MKRGTSNDGKEGKEKSSPSANTAIRRDSPRESQRNDRLQAREKARGRETRLSAPSRVERLVGLMAGPLPFVYFYVVVVSWASPIGADNSPEVPIRRY